MNAAWLSIPPAAILCCIYAYISYSHHKDTWWAPWVFTVLGLPGGFLWAWAIRHCQSKEAVMTFSIAWDVLAIWAPFYLFPIIALGVRPSLTTLIGLILVLTGMTVVILAGDNH